jgi:hypothetical protein
MARSLRIDVPQCTNRGVSDFAKASTDLFENVDKSFPAQRRTYIFWCSDVFQADSVCGFIAYVLMGNHYHLQLETPQANLSRAMQWLKSAF